MWRFCSTEYDPHDGSGAWEHGGRFNPPGIYAVCLCTSLDCVYAEHHRFLARASHDAKTRGTPIPITALNVYEGRVGLTRVLELTSTETADRVGISRQDLVAQDTARCRTKAEEAYHARYEAIPSKSAAQEGRCFAERDDTLVVFPERLVGGFAFERIVNRWPATVVD